jgi:hypothetical protein
MLYQEWMEEGKRELVKKALRKVLTEGLRSPHHFYITFRTQYPGVIIPDTLHAQYPEEMTIVINDAFWNLQVQEDLFSVDLLFDHQKQTLRVPYTAMVNFIDPGVEFALQFNWEVAQPPVLSSNVIFLDRFRRPAPLL